MADEKNQETELPGEQTQEMCNLPSLAMNPLESGLLVRGIGGSTNSKTNWPEAVGLTVEEAQNKIKIDAPNIKFQVVHPDNFVTMDFNQKRVRLYIDSSGKVARAPMLG
ncbi:hypothetical protein GIB67_012232 [Kingdonia uniflora]|uniref:Uncharacterized protein n=1 Tax=Kingdonia uniflora TaxID=39325 RepID=A0A7J7M956_9MAGN|nr:hypothetical protein GIB67_012232 [Kingdonia uniflora]